MIRKIAFMTFGLALIVSQAASAEPNDDEKAVLELAETVCVKHLGDGALMNEAAATFTGEFAKTSVAKAGEFEIPVQSYRYTADGKYLAFVSILWDGEACAVNFADTLVRPSEFQNRFGIAMAEGVHGGALYGMSSVKPMVVSFSKFEGEDGPVLSVGFLSKPAYRKEQSITGAPNVGWGG